MNYEIGLGLIAIATMAVTNRVNPLHNPISNAIGSAAKAATDEIMSDEATEYFARRASEDIERLNQARTLVQSGIGFAIAMVKDAIAPQDEAVEPIALINEQTTIKDQNDHIISVDFKACSEDLPVDVSTSNGDDSGHEGDSRCPTASDSSPTETKKKARSRVRSAKRGSDSKNDNAKTAKKAVSEPRAKRTRKSNKKTTDNKVAA